MISWVIKFLLSYPRLRIFLIKIYRQSINNSPDNLITDLPEIRPIRVKPSLSEVPRLNLLVPALSANHVFGGITTALDFFKVLIPAGWHARIIITDEVGFEKANNSDFLSWNLLTTGDQDRYDKSIAVVSTRQEESIHLRKNDFFVASAWWTAHLAGNLIEAAALLYEGEPKKTFVYLIQDYEPGFYPWSTRYALAEASYRLDQKMIAVFNTKTLNDYFRKAKYRFSRAYYFEPVINPRLLPSLKRSETLERQKKILIYGRPSVGRNAFELIVMALRSAVSMRSFNGWSFHSAGEQHGDINLGGGNVLKSLGKLSIDEYANELHSTCIGISLMISPHPSYPPLEMAAFGVKVITNNYDSKDLSFFSSNIFSIPNISVGDLANKLVQLVDLHETNSNEHVDLSPYMAAFISEKNPYISVCADIQRALISEVEND